MQSSRLNIAQVEGLYEDGFLRTVVYDGIGYDLGARNPLEAARLKGITCGSFAIFTSFMIGEQGVASVVWTQQGASGNKHHGVALPGSRSGDYSAFHIVRYEDQPAHSFQVKRHRGSVTPHKGLSALHAENPDLYETGGSVSHTTEKGLVTIRAASLEERLAEWNETDFADQPVTIDQIAESLAALSV